MGMYTELVLKCYISANTPLEVEGVLRHLFRAGGTPETLPDHPFFKLPRWDFIGRSNSFYHTPFALSDYRQPNNEYDTGGEKTYLGGYIFSRSDLKNYDGEIAAFLDWLDPYIDEEQGMCIGWTWYEENAEPTLIFKKEVA